MPRAIQQLAQQLSRDVGPCLRAACLLMFGLSVVVIPQAGLRLAESTTVELLPEDSESGQHEESGSQLFAVRTAHSRWRLIVCIPPAGSSSSHPCQASYTEDAELAGWQDFAEKTKPMRC